MIPILPETAAGTYATAGSIFVEGTILVTLAMISILALSAPIARRYFLQVLRKFTLRLAADIWWLLFVVLRDASIFLMVLLGFMLFWPGTYQDIAIAVPFQPLAIDMFAIALVILLLWDTEEEPFFNSLLTLFVLLGTVMYTAGTVFVTESATQLAAQPPAVSNSASNI